MNQHFDRPLRIALLTDTYLPVCNGVTRMVSLSARRLAQLGHEPQIFTFASPVELHITPEGLMSETPYLLRVPSEESEEGVVVHRAPALPVGQTDYFFGVRYPLWMRSQLAEMDVIHVHHPFISGRLALRFAEPHQPIIFTNHTRYDIYSHYVSRVVPFVPEQTIGQRLTRRVARFANRCDAVIAPSASLSRVLSDWGVVAPTHTIPNGIELSRFHAAARKAEYSENAPVAHAPTAVYLGRIAPEKNVEALLRAFAVARKTVPDARLKIIGGGPSEEAMRQLAHELGLENSVHFAGLLPYEDVPRALAEANLFVSASMSEVHPLTFIEAMAAGLPCLGVPSPGVSDTICDGENGWLTSLEDFPRVLSHALQSRDELRRRARLALKSSAAYSIENTVAQSLALYQKLLRQKMRDG